MAQRRRSRLAEQRGLPVQQPVEAMPVRRIGNPQVSPPVQGAEQVAEARAGRQVAKGLVTASTLSLRPRICIVSLDLHSLQLVQIQGSGADLD